jgi:hypothetical protein
MIIPNAGKLQVLVSVCSVTIARYEFGGLQ